MQELKKKNVKVLSEKALLLLNRGGKVTPVVFCLQLVSTEFNTKTCCPFLSRRPCVYVQTHPACTALSTQISAGCFCQPGDGRHLLQHWHDGDDRHSCSTNIWPLAWWQGEKHNWQLLIFLSLKRGRFTFCRRSLPCCWVRWEISCLWYLRNTLESAAHFSLASLSLSKVNKIFPPASLKLTENQCFP